jgi:hypothetical protein
MAPSTHPPPDGAKEQAMKFRLTMQDPDQLTDACEDAARKSLADLGLDADEMGPLIAKRAEKLSGFAGRWIEYDEYITIEFDTDAGTAVVVPLK